MLYAWPTTRPFGSTVSIACLSLCNTHTANAHNMSSLEVQYICVYVIEAGSPIEEIRYRNTGIREQLVRESSSP